MAISGDLFKLVHLRTPTISTDIWWPKPVWSVCSQRGPHKPVQIFSLGDSSQPSPHPNGDPLPLPNGDLPFNYHMRGPLPKFVPCSNFFIWQFPGRNSWQEGGWPPTERHSCTTCTHHYEVDINPFRVEAGYNIPRVQAVIGRG